MPKNLYPVVLIVVVGLFVPRTCDVSRASETVEPSKLAMEHPAELPAGLLPPTPGLFQEPSTPERVMQIARELERDPDSRSNHVLWAEALLTLKAHTQSYHVNRSIVEKFPDRRKQSFRLADYHLLLGRYPEAIGQYANLLQGGEGKPDAVRWHRSVAYCLRRVGRQEDAEEHEAYATWRLDLEEQELKTRMQSEEDSRRWSVQYRKRAVPPFMPPPRPDITIPPDRLEEWSDSLMRERS